MRAKLDMWLGLCNGPLWYYVCASVTTGVRDVRAWRRIIGRGRCGDDVVRSAPFVCLSMSLSPATRHGGRQGPTVRLIEVSSVAGPWRDSFIIRPAATTCAHLSPSSLSHRHVRDTQTGRPIRGSEIFAARLFPSLSLVGRGHRPRCLTWG